MIAQSLQSRPELPVVELGGLRLHALTELECVDHIIAEHKQGIGGWVVTPNLDHLRRFQSDLDFQGLVSQANLVTADGMPLIWMSRVQGTPLPERVAGSSLIDTLSRAAARDEHMSIYLDGGRSGHRGGSRRYTLPALPRTAIGRYILPPSWSGTGRDDAAMFGGGAVRSKGRHRFCRPGLSQAGALDRSLARLPAGSVVVGSGSEL